MSAVIAVVRASRPHFKNGMAKVAFAIHASFLAAGYRLVAAGAPAEEEPPADIGAEQDVGIVGWDLLEDRFAFRYVRDGEPRQRVIVKALGMDDVLMVDATSGVETEPLHLELRVADYTTESASSDYAAHYRNLDDLAKLIDSHLIAHLAKPSATSAAAGQPSSTAVGRQDRQDGAGHAGPGVMLEEPPRPSPLMEGQPRRGGMGVPVPGMPGVEIPPFGGDDLDSFSGGGIMPPRFGGSGGSMLVGPHDPRWGGMQTGEYPGPFGRQPPGGLPPGVPSGARFDPYGPPGIPGFEPGRFGNGGRRPGGRGGPPSHPDLEFFPPQ